MTSGGHPCWGGQDKRQSVWSSPPVNPCSGGMSHRSKLPLQMIGSLIRPARRLCVDEDSQRDCSREGREGELFANWPPWLDAWSVAPGGPGQARQVHAWARATALLPLQARETSYIQPATKIYDCTSCLATRTSSYANSLKTDRPPGNAPGYVVEGGTRGFGTKIAGGEGGGEGGRFYREGACSTAQGRVFIQALTDCGR